MPRIRPLPFRPSFRSHLHSDSRSRLRLAAFALAFAAPALLAIAVAEARPSGPAASGTMAASGTLAASRGSEADAAPVHDPHSYGNPAEVRPTHLALDLALDFDAREIRGSVTIEFQRRTPTRRLVLDTREVIVERAVGITPAGLERVLTHTVHAPEAPLGSALEIELPPAVDRVRVEYCTRPDATAVQWLAPELTRSGEHPFLFTQSQSIHARSWIPCMDSPGVRVTYDATIRVPEGLTAVMSAEPGEATGEPGVFHFRMPQSIPPYLIALAAGELESRDVSPRVRIWAEPAVVDAAAHEFADTGRMIRVVEELYGPYVWGRYDLLVLPPSFPFGGMENPRLSFLTPTVLAGDRSLVSLIAHELAHSWSGNLVTNATWRDFWINEGFTTYVERRVIEALYGRDIAEMEAILGKHDLLEDIAYFGADHEFTALAPDLAGDDPDDAFSSVPYEKGYLLLRRLEELVGRRRFDAFLRSLFDRHAFGNLTTEEVESAFEALLAGAGASAGAGAGASAADARGEVDLEAWLYEPGLPDDVPEIRSAEFARVEMQVERVRAGAPPAELDVDGWRATHWIQFLRRLPRELDDPTLAALDDAFGFTASKNSEIFFAWSLLVAHNGYEPAFGAIEQFLSRVGRIKFLAPLYAELRANPDTRELARRVYEDARPRLHPLAHAAIDPLFDEEDEGDGD